MAAAEGQSCKVLRVTPGYVMPLAPGSAISRMSGPRSAPLPSACGRGRFIRGYIYTRGLGGTRYCSYAAFMAHNRAVPAARTDYFGLINLITPLQLRPPC